MKIALDTKDDLKTSRSQHREIYVGHVADVSQLCPGNILQLIQSRAQSPQALWPADGRQERLWKSKEKK